ncbi:MAG: capsule assembly Wzi family protein, partial [Woeseiaceae bacterium]
MPQTLRINAFLVALLLFAAEWANASPLIEAGDAALRNDIRLLADVGIITGPVSGWPLAWAPILENLRDVDTTGLSQNVGDAMFRVLARGSWETRVDEIQYNAEISAAEKPNRLRSFQDTPREKAELSLGASWTGDFLSADLNGQVVASPSDDKEYRYDHSLLAVLLGNCAISANTLDRWWGPGWDGSLI